MLGVPPTNVVVTDDPQRGYGGFPGQLITVHDPDDTAAVLRFIPETGNIGAGGGAYLLLEPCPGCSTERRFREVPMMSVARLADLGVYQQHIRPIGDEAVIDIADARGVPIEFFDDPGHASDCSLR